MLEPAGIALAGTINAFAYLAWSLWLVATGVSLLRARSTVADSPAMASAVPAYAPLGTLP